MLNKLIRSFGYIAIACTFAPSVVQAQTGGRPELSGEIALEVEDAAESGYSSSQKKALETFNRVLEQLDSLRKEGTADIPVLDDNAIQYLSAVYLFCTINQGTCPVVLDALLELDLMESMFRGSVQCPRLTTLWKLWLKNDMERRQEYLVKTAYMNVSDEFKRNKRGRYIKCKETLESMLNFEQPRAQFFSARYQEASPELSSLKQMVALLETIKSKVGNVYDAVGVQIAGSGTDSKAQRKGSGGVNGPSLKQIPRKSSKTTPD